MGPCGTTTTNNEPDKPLPSEETPESCLRFQEELYNAKLAQKPIRTDLENAIERLAIAHGKSQAAPHVTVSLGVDTSITSGRNRVSAWDGQTNIPTKNA